MFFPPSLNHSFGIKMVLFVVYFFDARMTSHIIGLSVCQCLTFKFHPRNPGKPHAF